MTTPIIRLLLLAVAIAIVKRSYYTISFTPIPILSSYNQRYAKTHMICTNRIHLRNNAQNRAMYVHKKKTCMELSSSSTSTLNDTNISLPPTQASTLNSTTTTALNSDAVYYQCNVNENEYYSKGNQTNTTSEDELFASLLNKIEVYSPQIVNTQSINNNNSSIPAYQFAKASHEGQCRLSGEPYIIHPLKVAHIIADMKLDLPSLLCAILHDTVEDTSVTLEDIATTFDEDIAMLVDGVTKVGQIPITWSVEQKQSENYRKLILSMSRDIRVLLVKLADRTHNMRTLEYMSNEKQIRISRETLDIYVPLAHRLGIYWLKTELEDNCFKFLYPDKYQELYGKVEGSETERKQYEDMVVELLIRQMTEAGMENNTLQVTGRTKGFYSIYTKMKKQDLEFDDVHDVLAFRIIVNDVASCYQALGIVHSFYKPCQIALPKPNHQYPKREWLYFVRTSKARNRIKSWLKRQEREKSMFSGKEMIEKGLKLYTSRGSDGKIKKEYQRKMSHLLTTFKLKDEEHLLAALGDGQLPGECNDRDIWIGSCENTRQERT